MAWRRFVCTIFVCTGFSCAAPPKALNESPPPVYSGEYRGVRGTVGYLASDELEGRGLGTTGLDVSAAYIHQCFSSFGLHSLPATRGDCGLGNFYQSFPLRQSTGVDPTSTLTALGRPAALNQAFRPLSLSGEGTFDAPLVFAGFGVSRPTAHYDDYADLDVKGKAVLILRYEPRDKAGNSIFTRAREWSESVALATKAKAAQNRGAVAVLLVEPVPNQLISFRRGPGEGITIPVLSVTQELANQWLARGAVRDVTALRDQIESDGRPASAILADVRVAGVVKLATTTTWLRNVVAVLPGKGPTADEYIVVGAHYDHLGLGTGARPQVHNGADDNASGTAALLELARRLSKHPEPPKRSILFVAFTAEESGIIGSTYFVKNPPVPLEKIVAMVNFDMVGRVRNDQLMVGGGGTAGAFKPILKQADDASPLVLKSSGDGGWGPSDHMAFALRKIPVLFFWSGVHVDYHTPTDDADKINYAGLDQVITLAENVIARLCAMPKQEYVATFDGKLGDPHGGVMAGELPSVTLGVVPDYNAGENVIGVRIAGARDGSPAAKAGLKEGDIVVKLGDADIESIYGLTGALRIADADKPTTVTILRDGHRLELPVTLEKRKH